MLERLSAGAGDYPRGHAGLRCKRPEVPPATAFSLVLKFRLWGSVIVLEVEPDPQPLVQAHDLSAKLRRGTALELPGIPAAET